MSHDTNKLQSIAGAFYGLLVASNHNPEVEEFFSDLVEGLAEQNYIPVSLVPLLNVPGLTVESVAVIVAYLHFDRKDDAILPTMEEFIALATDVASHAEEAA